MTKVLFIYPDVREDPEEYTSAIAKKEYEGMFYTGIASISAVLKQHGHETKLFHITEPMVCENEPNNKEYLIDKNGNLLFDILEDFNPDIVAFSSTTNQFEVVKKICIYMNQWWRPNLVICGGVHAILAPEEVIAVEGIDAVCTGEGEYTLLALAEGTPLCSAAGLWYKIEKYGGAPASIVRRPPRKLIENLDELPFPDREIFDYENTYGGTLGRLDMVVSRGCPYNCTYCCNHALKGRYGVGYFRMNSPEYVVSEIETSLKQYPNLKYVDFRDDCFTINREWTMKFIELYKERVNLPIVIISRADKLDEPMLKALSEVRCRMIRIGVESGNQEVLQSLHRTIITPEMIKKTAELCHKHGIKIYPFYMIGLPDETPTKFFDTIRLHGDLAATGAVDLNTYHLSVFYPFPKTKLYDYCKDKGYLTDRNSTNYFTDSILDIPQFPRDDIKFLREKFALLTKAYLLRKGIYI